MDNEHKQLKIWHHILKPILRFLYNRLNPSTQAELNRVFAPFLTVGGELLNIYYLFTFAFIDFIMIWVWPDMYAGNQAGIPIGSSQYYFFLFVIGIMIIFISMFTLILTKKVIKTIIHVIYIIVEFRR